MLTPTHMFTVKESMLLVWVWVTLFNITLSIRFPANTVTSLSVTTAYYSRRAHAPDFRYLCSVDERIAGFISSL